MEGQNRRVLSDGDIAALAETLRKALRDEHPCTFDEETRVALKRISEADPNVLVKLADAYQDATSYIWKGLLGLALIALMWLALFGFSIEKKIGG